MRALDVFLGPVVVLAALFATFVAAMIAVIVYAVRRRRQAIAEQERAMAQLGWIWVPPSAWLAEFAAQLFIRGEPIAMAAGWYRGREICCLDYRYTTSNGDTTQTHECHLVAINLPGALPPLTLTGQHRLVQLLAGRDLELENKAFNDLFRIDCDSDRYASAILHPRMMELMLANPWLDWRIAGNALVSWGPGRWTPAAATARLDLLCRIAELIPNFVLRDYGHPTY